MGQGPLLRHGSSFRLSCSLLPIAACAVALRLHLISCYVRHFGDLLEGRVEHRLQESELQDMHSSRV